jgi:AcrR family transcriptional regulator
MAQENHDVSPAIRVRKGTGTRRTGKASAQRIIKSANALLARGGHVQFSMRNVAAHAGLHLANVQYYFPTRDALLHALFQDIGGRYRQAYERCLAAAPSDRVARFRAVLAFNLKDIGRPVTRRYFVQLWALLDSLDGSSGRRLNELYEVDITQLSERIAEIDPAAAAADVRRRATLLAAMIEGLMIVQGAHGADENEKKRLMKQAQELGFSIALGRLDGNRALADANGD